MENQSLNNCQNLAFKILNVQLQAYLAQISLIIFSTVLVSKSTLRYALFKVENTLKIKQQTIVPFSVKQPYFFGRHPVDG